MKFAAVKRIFPSWKNALLAVLAAVLLILAFPDFEYWFLAWFALVPLMWAVDREKESIFRSFITGWIFGAIFFFGTCWWLTFAPIHYAGFPPWLAYSGMVLVAVVVGVFPAIFAAISSVLLRRFGSGAFLAAPFVWVFTEFLRYWMTGNNWNAIGYSQAFSWLTGQSIFTAQIGGIYLVGFTLLALNSLIASAFSVRRESEDTFETDERRGDAVPYAVVWLALSSFLFPIFALVFVVSVLHDYDKVLRQIRINSLRLLVVVLVIPTGFAFFIWLATIQPNFSYGMFSAGDAFVTAVQPNVPMSGIDPIAYERLRDRQIENAQSAMEENLARYRANDIGLFDNISDDEDVQFYLKRYSEKPKVVIFPESPMNFMYNDDREFQQFIGDFARRNNVSVLFNSAEPDATNGKYFNSAVMVGPEGREIAQYDKIFLLPFGEAVPPILEGIMPGFVGNFSYGREYDILPVGDAKAGVMICFESHFGQLSRHYVQNGADVIIEMTNDGYLGPTPVLRQHLANAVFRAVETNRPVLRVTNVGVTAYINERGEVIDPAPTYTEATRVWSVSKSDGSQTFYVKYGDWFAWLCSLVTIGLLIVSFRRRRPRQEQNSI